MEDRYDGSMIKERDFAWITEELLNIIGRNDKFQERLAYSIGISLEEFQDYIDTVDFPVIGKKDKHTL